MRRIPVLVGSLVGLLGVSGCRTLGPQTVPRDRFDYSASIAESWKRQTLLNIVKLRYLDPPIFVDVGQIVAGYSLETGISAGASLPSTDALGGKTATLGGSARFTDRPTVTYTPLTGSRFNRGLMMPLPPDAVFFAIQSGWPADGVLFASVATMNGLKNQGASLAGVTPPDEGFTRALELLRKIQLSGAVGMRIQQDAQKQQTSLLTFRSTKIPDETRADGRELRELLRLDPDADEFKLVFGATAANDRELAVQTRSILHIMQTMAVQAELPAGDVEQGRATPGIESSSGVSDRQRLVRIHSSKDEPAGAFVAVPYRGHWYWIDDRDLRTKRAFAFMMFLFTLADTGEKENLPLITIPAQ